MRLVDKLLPGNCRACHRTEADLCAAKQQQNRYHHIRSRWLWKIGPGSPPWEVAVAAGAAAATCQLAGAMRLIDFQCVAVRRLARSITPVGGICVNHYIVVVVSLHGTGFRTGRSTDGLIAQSRSRMHRVMNGWMCLCFFPSFLCWLDLPGRRL